MEKTIIKYVKGLPVDATRWEIRKNKKYGKLSNIVRNINYDIKHGVTAEEVLAVMQKIRQDKSFLELRTNPGTVQRLDELERQISTPRKVASW